MKNAIRVKDKDAPKVIRKKAKFILDLWRKGNLNKLRELRANSKNFQVLIYHHSHGTDSYYHDTEKRYYTWAQIEALNEEKLKRGEYFSTVVMPYPAGIIFHSSKTLPNPSLN